jgi:predicted peroxiredoxin
MAKLLVHLATGPENTTRGALAFLVARTAAAAGHEVTVFVAGDGVGFLREPTMDAAHGIGTGSVRVHLDALREADVRVYASGMSSKARGLEASAAGGLAVDMAPPDRLVELIMEADRVVTY